MARINPFFVLLSLLGIFFLVTPAADVQAQAVVARLKADSLQVLIGKPVQVTVELTQPGRMKIDWPETDTLDQLEILARSTVDTVKTTDPSILLRRQVYTVTAYDSATHVFPAQSFRYKDGSGRDQLALTDSVLLSFVPLQVDTTKAIRDIRPIAEVPFDWMPIVLGIIALIILCAVGYWLYVKWKRKQLAKQAMPKPVVKAPAHQIALEELKRLEEAKLWQQGNLKGYYTGVTDILRQYIERRWGINAMEMTSDEIVQHGFFTQLESTAAEPLNRLLRTSDLVKFAKSIPLPQENEQNMQIAVGFVKYTAEVTEKLNTKEGEEK